ncbi:MAG: hypothetical protein MZV64_09560 [Ignavibacteriales bacterium]|nr:hypothetical protein [Ignavibacteriales bacterium]
MVPNHTGIDSALGARAPGLVHPALDTAPSRPTRFSGREPLRRPAVGHLASRTTTTTARDAAVVFKRVDRRTGRRPLHLPRQRRHAACPGTTPPSSTSSSPRSARRSMQTILHVARSFPIIRFDAAMTLAKQHFQRLWYPRARARAATSRRAPSTPCRASDFDARHARGVLARGGRPRAPAEAPDTLLLAEAFWLMEGYFVRTLGMHRVYNSRLHEHAQDGGERQVPRRPSRTPWSSTREILKRFVNFMNNPDEETAVAQFGKGDKYFGVCTLLATLPGLPMFGHGQVEGFSEKYGMEYRRAYWDETPDAGPRRPPRARDLPAPASGATSSPAWTTSCSTTSAAGRRASTRTSSPTPNGAGGERALVAYNNAYARASGWVKDSAYLRRDPAGRRRSATSRNPWPRPWACPARTAASWSSGNSAASSGISAPPRTWPPRACTWP